MKKDKYEQLEDFQIVKYRIKEEGFHYCFFHYSSWNEINDKKFHKLKEEYIKSANELQTYIDKKIDKLQNEIGENL